MDIQLGHAAWIGLVATAVMTLALYLLPYLGFPRTDVTYFLGSVFRARRSRAALYGLAVHFGMGIIFAFLYGLGFLFLDVAPRWWTGAIGGIIHWLAVMASMDMVGEMHRGVREGRLRNPGFFMANLGAIAATGSLIRHITFGAMVGLLFDIYGE